MGLIRKYFGWTFAVSSVVCLACSIGLTWSAVHRQRGMPRFRTMLIEAVFLCMSLVFAMAWWNVWQEKAAARIWGVVGSLIYMLIALRDVFSSHSMTSSSWEVLTASMFGLAAFMWRNQKPDAGDFPPNHNCSLPADSLDGPQH